MRLAINGHVVDTFGAKRSTGMLETDHSCALVGELHEVPQSDPDDGRCSPRTSYVNTEKNNRSKLPR
jgi:hypothetical protein